MPYHFNILEPYADRLIHGVTDRTAGSFKEGNPEFQDSVQKLGLGQPTRNIQVHSDRILDVAELPDGLLPEADGFITQTKNLLLMVKVADCQGVILYDPEKHVVAAVHSGWKGSAQNILGKAVQQMKAHYHSEPKNILVGISPSLGPCCAQFTDPKNELPTFCHPYILDNNHVDFWQLSVKQLMDEGIAEEHIENARICSKCDSNTFSHRLGDEGRMAVFAKLSG